MTYGRVSELFTRGFYTGEYPCHGFRGSSAHQRTCILWVLLQVRILAGCCASEPEHSNKCSASIILRPQSLPKAVISLSPQQVSKARC